MICDEIKYAQEQNKRIILLVEKGLDIPDIVQEQNERIHTDDKITEYDLVELVNSLHKLYIKGIFPAT